MSVKKKYLEEEDLKKLDTFIQDSLYKYFYVNPWERLYINTGRDHRDIISDKSTIPDLVIYNKSFNKRDCFLNSKKNNKYVKFPRTQFLLRPKKVDYYNPSCTYGEDKKEKEEKEEEDIKLFEFKSIPKEIEDKFININKKENAEKNLLLDELEDFMKNDNDNDAKAKVKIVQECESQELEKNEKKEKGKEKHDDKESPKEKNKEQMKASNKDNYYKNKFGAPINVVNMNNLNMNLNLNSNIIRNNNFNIYMAMKQKMIQNIQYQNYIKKILENNYLINNKRQANKFNQPKKENNMEKIKNDGNNFDDKNNDKQKNKNIINAISYFKNTNTNEKNEKEKIKKYIHNMDEIFLNNINNRGWKVVDNRSNNLVNIFNNQELFYFLNCIINRKETNNYFITDLESDFFFNPISLYEKLKDMFQKKDSDKNS